MNYQQLVNLWIAQGGNPAYAPIMAAIALAESSGDPSNTTGDNGTSYGLWQIHWTVHPQFNPAQLTDPAYNTQAAIQLSGNGAGLANEGDQTPWTTFNSWVRGDGGHGDQVISSILGPYTGQIPTTAATGSAGAGSATSGSGSGSSSSAAGDGSGIQYLSNIGSIPIVGPALEGVSSEIIVGAFALLIIGIGGIWLIFGNKGSRTVVVNASKTAALAAE